MLDIYLGVAAPNVGFKLSDNMEKCAVPWGADRQVETRSPSTADAQELLKLPIVQRRMAFIKTDESCNTV